METTLDQLLGFILDVSSQMSPVETTNEVLGLEHIAGQTDQGDCMLVHVLVCSKNSYSSK